MDRSSADLQPQTAKVHRFPVAAPATESLIVPATADAFAGHPVATLDNARPVVTAIIAQRAEALLRSAATDTRLKNAPVPAAAVRHCPHPATTTAVLIN